MRRLETCLDCFRLGCLHNCHRRNRSIVFHRQGKDLRCWNIHHRRDRGIQIDPRRTIQLGLDNHRIGFHQGCFQSRRRLHRTTVMHRLGKRQRRNNRFEQANLRLGQNTHHRPSQDSRDGQELNRPIRLDTHRLGHSSARRLPNHHRYLSTVFGRAGRRRYFVHRPR